MFDVEAITSPAHVDCAPTCLRMLLRYYGIDEELPTLNRKSNLGVFGCTAADVKRVAAEYGIDLKVYSMSAEELIRQDRPAIIHWKYNHFCVFCGTNAKGDVVICNPDRGRFGLDQETFSVLYSGTAMFNGEPHDLPHVPTLEEKLNALMEYMGLTGKWNGSVFEVVKPDMPTGDYTKPIPYEVGMAVDTGKFYIFPDENIWEARKTGYPSAYDNEWFDIIG